MILTMFILRLIYFGFEPYSYTFKYFKLIKVCLEGCQVEPPNPWKIPYVVVHYEGSYDVKSGQKNPPHGNCKSTPTKASARILREILGEPSPSKPQGSTSPPASRVDTASTPDMGLVSSPVRQIATKRTGGYYTDGNISKLFMLYLTQSEFGRLGTTLKL